MAYPFSRHTEPRSPRGRSGFEFSLNTPPRLSRTRAKAARRCSLAIWFVIAVLCYLIFFQPLGLRNRKQHDRIPLNTEETVDYFSDFEGQDCSIHSRSLYSAVKSFNPPLPYCSTRASLITALSQGGRHGFDAPYVPLGCNYRWYNTAEICMILDRFDGVVFVGDDMVAAVYAAFNMLLREDLALGGLRSWEMVQELRRKCRCDEQVINGECAGKLIEGSEELKGDEVGTPYICNRTSHKFLRIFSSPIPADTLEKLRTMLSKDPDSYKPIPVIHGIGLSASLSYVTATSSMDEWLEVLSSTSSYRSTPYLWIGPNAAGHLKPPGLILNQGNNALWHYTVQMKNEATKRNVEAMSMYNATLQASSWDGSGYGIRVGLVQAMMIINWLARLEST